MHDETRRGSLYVVRAGGSSNGGHPLDGECHLSAFQPISYEHRRASDQASRRSARGGGEHRPGRIRGHCLRRWRWHASRGDPWSRVKGFGFRVWGLGFRVQGLGFMVQGLGFRV